MPRNRGTSRKGKPKKMERAAGMGRALERSQVKRYVPKSNGSSMGVGGMAASGAESIHNAADVATDESAMRKSLLEVDQLTDFLAQAEMANREFASERERFVVLDSAGVEYQPHEPRVRWEDDEEGGHTGGWAPNQVEFHELSVPRRPEWDVDTSAEELHRLETEAFLEWRRNIARLEERAASSSRANVTVTPFEKNLEVWRQLWRVLERSSCLVQILDARNPLFYYSEDLRRYATDELGKPMAVLVNKSDFLTEAQRRAWHTHFESLNLSHAFFSAHAEQKLLDEAARAEARRLDEEEGKLVSPTFLIPKQRNDDDDEEVENSEDDEEGSHDDQNVELEADETNSDGKKDDVYEDENPNNEGSEKLSVEEVNCKSYPSDIERDPTQLLSRKELLRWLRTFASTHGCMPSPSTGRIEFGTVGFPNVGKSSVINVLMGNSVHTHNTVRVAVAPQPGKTKHFQTVLLDNDNDNDDDLDDNNDVNNHLLMLVDCPGLVFPSAVRSVADLIAAGVYPLSQMRDAQSIQVIDLLCRRFPSSVWSEAYGGSLIMSPSQRLDPARALLDALCRARHMVNGQSGNYDHHTASRLLIQDYLGGRRLLYCHPPPGADVDAYHQETLATLRCRNYGRKSSTAVTDNIAEVKEKEERNLSFDQDVGQEKGHGVDNGGENLNLTNVGGEPPLTSPDALEDILLEEFLQEETSAAQHEKQQQRQLNKSKHHNNRPIGKKWGKKGKKLKNKDPYGCHEADSLAIRGIVANGKYGGGGYTRPNYVGPNGAVRKEVRIDGL